MIAQGLPETQALLLLDPKSHDPLRALPEIQMRDDEPGGRAVFGFQGLIVGLIGDERLVVDEVGDRQVRRLEAVGVGGDERRLGVQFNGLEQGVDADALPLHTQLGPVRDAAEFGMGREGIGVCTGRIIEGQ
jgi:hypothetical protein